MMSFIFFEIFDFSKAEIICMKKNKQMRVHRRFGPIVQYYRSGLWKFTFYRCARAESHPSLTHCHSFDIGSY